jgi:DNA-directed RNA polymerase subunit RPC12/RpoP
MAMVNYQCGSCGSVVAMESDSLGQAVSCPHCHHSVLSLLTLSSAPPEVAPLPTPAEEPESIFAPEQTDALFGGSIEPDVERSAGIAAPGAPEESSPTPFVPPLEDALFSTPSGTPVEASIGADWLGQLAPVVPEVSVSDPDGLEGPPSQSSTVAMPAEPVAVAAPDSQNKQAIPPSTEALMPPCVPTDEQSPSATDLSRLMQPEATIGLQPFAPPPPRRPVSRGLGSRLFIALVFIPLVSYAILATIAVFVLYQRNASAPSPMEYLPDIEGDYKGGKHQKDGLLSYQRLDPESDLPDRLKVGLGNSIRVGDVEVRPERVELRPLVIRVPGFEPEEQGEASLVLHLHLRNVSSDVVFSPTDPYFDRRWKPSQANKPYTFLEILDLPTGKMRLFGGPLVWKPGRPTASRQLIDGQAYQMLRPGEQLATVVCTDPADEVGRLLKGYHGRLLWRVQFRRGLVEVGEREVSATAVVVVQFSDRDVPSS